MAGPKTIIELDGDSAKLFQAFQSIINQQVKLEGGLKKSAQAAKEAAREEAALTREAKKVYEETRTPQERYNQKLRELSGLLKQNKIDQDTYGRAVRQAKGELDGVGSAGVKAFGPQALGMLKGFAGALGLGGGIAGALGLVKQQYEGIMEVQQRAKEATLTVAQAQAQALRNLAPSTEAEAKAFTEGVAKMAMETGVSQVGLYKRESSALSARGNLPVEVAQAAVRATAQLVPEDQETGIKLTGAALDLLKIAGPKARGTPDEQAQQAIGLLMATAGTARPENIGTFSAAAMSAVKEGVARGGTMTDMLALFSAMTGGMVDVTGEKSSTAMISLIEKMKEQAVPGKSPMEQIKALQADPGLRAAFLEEGKFELKARQTIEELLTPGSGAVAELEDFQRRIPSLAAGAPLFKRTVGIIQNVPEQKLAAMERRFKTTEEALGTADLSGAEAALILEHFGPLLEGAGMGKLQASLKKFKFSWATGDTGTDERARQDLLKQITAQRQELQTKYLVTKYQKEDIPEGARLVSKEKVGDVFSLGTKPYTAYTVELPPTELDARRAKILRGLESELRDLGNKPLRPPSAADELAPAAVQQVVPKPAAEPVGPPPPAGANDLSRRSWSELNPWIPAEAAERARRSKGMVSEQKEDEGDEAFHRTVWANRGGEAARNRYQEDQQRFQEEQNRLAQEQLEVQKRTATAVENLGRRPVTLGTPNNDPGRN